MPSKGIQAYAYIAVDGCAIEFSVSGSNVSRTALREWSSDHLEIESSKIPGHLNFVGRFQVRVTRNGSEITTQWNDIDSFTGRLKNDGTMTSIRNEKAVVSDGIVVAYGFYDAGAGEFGLPSRDQCWVTVSSLQTNWMAQIAPQGSLEAEKPFSRFVLPTPHDVGMNSMENSSTVLRSQAFDWLAKQMLGVVGGVIGEVVDVGAHTAYIGNLIYSLALCQKETVSVLLAMGARYMEFRPGKLPDNVREHSGLDPNKYYFLHAFIPGLAFEEFLEDVLQFLEQNPGEIFIVHTRTDGIISQCVKPSVEEKRAILDGALATHVGIELGVDTDLDLTVRELREQRKRLIWLDSANQYSSYGNGSAYDTLNGDTIIQALDGMGGTAEQEAHLFTLLQCQATASENKEVVAYSVADSHAGTSCLMATKAVCTAKTIPWVRDHVMDRFQAERLVVVMNDFFDGATVDVAIDLSKQRFAK